MAQSKDGHAHDHHDHQGHDHGGHDHGGHHHGGHGHDHHGHDHQGHAHGLFGGHVHAPASFGPAFAIGIAVNLGFIIVEVTAGLVANSMALLADAGHNLSDVLGLAIAWLAVVLSTRAPGPRYTYGLKNSSILAALANAVLLLVAVGAIAWEAVRRLIAPEPVGGWEVVLVAAIGIAVNGVTAWLLAGGRRGDLNIRGAYLHMVADAAVSAAVVVAGLVILGTGWTWLDPLVSLLVAAVIVHQTWSLLTGSLAMSLSAVPPGVDYSAVAAFLASRPGVSAVHDLHIWPIGTTDVALTCHLVRPGAGGDDAFLMATCTSLQERFGIGHATLQVETDPATACPLAPAEVV